MSGLPSPGRTRWQPLRAGLVDLFYYDEEEFGFRDGRLLLRGNNGTGKSKVLALLLPFLLDGDLAPHRVEPDADRTKRMEWNLLLGGEHPHPERLGYTWLELGRRDEDGTEHFLTIGCGLKAVTGRGIARHWFFTTDKRVGAELALVDATRTALSRERLVDALAGRGAVHDRARDHRRAVDEALFGLGEQRYGALVDLLVQLRQPQLSKKPSEAALSAALTESLPPLDQAVVADVAEAFRSLEADRDALVAMEEAHTSARGFLGHYRRYAAVVARRRAEGPRRAQQEYRTATEALAAAERAHAEAVDGAESAAQALVGLEQEQQRLRVQEQTLRASPEMRSATELERAGADVELTTADLAAAEQDRVRAAGTRQGREERRDAARTALDERATALGRVVQETRAAAATARLGDRHDAEVAGDLSAAGVAGVARDLATGQERALAEVRRALTRVGAADGAVAAAAREEARLDDEATGLAQRRSAAAAAVGVAGAALVAAVRAHLADSPALPVPDVAAVLAALELWVDTLDGPDPARVAVDAAGRAAGAAIAREHATIDAREAAGRAQLGELDEELARLADGEDTAPPTPHTRSGQARVRPGAPLWRVVDFAPGLGGAERAGLEAALEAAGLLDAWLEPDGDLRSADGDLLLRPLAAAPPRSLDQVLVPALDPENPGAAAVGEPLVARVLAALGLGESSADTWADTDGRFRVGALTGAWTKPVARYVGRGAREAARRARTAELVVARARAQGELDGVLAAAAALDARRAELAGVLAATPTDDELRSAHAHAVVLVAEHARLTTRRSAARAGAEAASGAAETAHSELDELAVDLDLPSDPAALDEVAAGVNAYRLALAALWPAVRAAATARDHLADTEDELTAAAAELHTRTGRRDDAESRRRAALTHHETLVATVGVAAAEVLRRLDVVVGTLRDLAAQLRTATARREAAVEHRGATTDRVTSSGAELTRATTSRAGVTEALRRFAGTGLLAVALPELVVPDPEQPWAPDPTVRLARQVETELAEVDVADSAWTRVQRTVNDELKSLGDVLARHGNQAVGEMVQDGIVVTVVFVGRPTTVPELEAALGTEVADRRRLLQAHERDILEKHLVDEAASTLQELIGEADAQVARMNAELETRPTSTGMRLRIRWRAREDGPAGLAEARRRLLRQSSDAWSEQDRAAVGGFLQEQIVAVRARAEGGTWLEHLSAALDYRGWHRFVIERFQNGQWRPATGPASGGERVLAASVPLFAAASAHYSSAGNPHAPRIVTLDEAFAGVDDDARAQYLGLLASFDLDVVMTSEREWGCYPQVPGLAIAQLARAEGVPAVLVTSFEWDGHTLREVPRPVVVTAATPPPEDSLFGDL